MVIKASQRDESERMRERKALRQHRQYEYIRRGVVMMIPMSYLVIPVRNGQYFKVTTMVSGVRCLLAYCTHGAPPPPFAMCIRGCLVPRRELCLQEHPCGDKVQQQRWLHAMTTQGIS